LFSFQPPSPYRFVFRQSEWDEFDWIHSANTSAHPVKHTRVFFNNVIRAALLLCNLHASLLPPKSSVMCSQNGYAGDVWSSELCANQCILPSATLQ
jgi:hypothetical protein